MKTIKHISLWVVVATCMVAVSTRGNAQAVSSTYFNVDWQFNAPVGNSYADKASGWGMNFEGGYYVMPKMAIGAFISYHTNNKYIKHYGTTPLSLFNKKGGIKCMNIHLFPLYTETNLFRKRPLNGTLYCCDHRYHRSILYSY